MASYESAGDYAQLLSQGEGPGILFAPACSCIAYVPPIHEMRKLLSICLRHHIFGMCMCFSSFSRPAMVSAPSASTSVHTGGLAPHQPSPSLVGAFPQVKLTIQGEAYIGVMLQQTLVVDFQACPCYLVVCEQSSMRSSHRIFSGYPYTVATCFTVRHSVPVCRRNESCNASAEGRPVTIDRGARKCRCTEHATIQLGV